MSRSDFRSAPELHRDIPKWHMGNPSKRRRLIENFGKTSTLHGMAYLCWTRRKKSIYVGMIYRVFFTACFLFVIYSVVSLLKEYLDNQSTFVNTINQDLEKGTEEDPVYFPLFPRITICRMPFYKTDFNSSYLRLVEYATMSLGPPFKALTVTERGMLVQIILYQLQRIKGYSEEALHLWNRLEQSKEMYDQLKAMGDFDLRQFMIDHSPNCSEFFSSCHISFLKVECCEMFQPILTSDGLCFTDITMNHVYQLLQREVVVDFHISPALAHRSKVGFRVLLTDPFEEPFIDLEDINLGSYDVVPGLTTTFNIQLAKTQRFAKYTPWHELWNTCPKPWNNQSDRYSFQTCNEGRNANLIKVMCKCESLIYSTGTSTLRICDPIDWYQCRMHNIHVEAQTQEHCEEACLEYTFEAEISSSELGGEGNISRIEIKYNSFEYTFHEYKKTTISSILSQIGGSLGLYLGASIITVMEIVIFVVRWTWYRLAPAKLTTLSRQATLFETRHDTDRPPILPQSNAKFKLPCF